MTALHTNQLEDLRKAGVVVHHPGDAGYEAAARPWNLAVAQHPAAVAEPTTAEEVAAVVRSAAAAGLRVAPQGTGHSAGPLGDLGDTVLLRTTRMTGARVVGDVVRVAAGALWEEVVTAAAAARRSVLHGSSPDVGVLGYSLGGGLGWYARQHGLQCNAITAAEVVLADGSFVRADATQHADLFWALRGGGGNLGIVTALEFRTFDFTTAYGGMLAWDATHVEDVLPHWAEWTQDAPDEVTTSLRLLQLPAAPRLPETLRGRKLVAIDGAVLAGDDTAERILAPLRALRPEIDTFARVPSSSLVRLHMDPEGPTPAVSASALLSALPAPAQAAFVAAATGSSLVGAELKQLGGAVGRPAPGGGALPCLDGQFLLFGVAVARDAESGRKGQADAHALTAALAPWHTGRRYLNFSEQAVDPAEAYDPATLTRLRQVQHAVDPAGLVRANHPVR